MNKPTLFKTKESITINKIRRLKMVNKDYTPGYTFIKSYFVDSSGFGFSDELAMTFNAFIDEIKPGYAYGIIDAGQFQVYIGEFKPLDNDPFIARIEYLKPIYDSRKSFYNKAVIIREDNKIKLPQAPKLGFLDIVKRFVVNTLIGSNKLKERLS
jgi:hypothetical protein